MKAQKYKITWGEGQSQIGSKTDVLKIAAELLIQYPNVTISKIIIN